MCWRLLSPSQLGRQEEVGTEGTEVREDEKGERETDTEINTESRTVSRLKGRTEKNRRKRRVRKIHYSSITFELCTCLRIRFNNREDR